MANTGVKLSSVFSDKVAILVYEEVTYIIYLIAATLIHVSFMILVIAAHLNHLQHLF